MERIYDGLEANLILKILKFCIYNNVYNNERVFIKVQSTIKIPSPLANLGGKKLLEFFEKV